MTQIISSEHKAVTKVSIEKMDSIYLCENHSEIAVLLYQLLADLLGVRLSLSEPIQGQRY